MKEASCFFSNLSEATLCEPFFGWGFHQAQPSIVYTWAILEDSGLMTGSVKIRLPPRYPPLPMACNAFPSFSVQLGLGPEVTAEGVQAFPGKVMLSKTESPRGGSDETGSNGSARRITKTREEMISAVSWGHKVQVFR